MTGRALAWSLGLLLALVGLTAAYVAVIYGALAVFAGAGR